MDDQKDYGIEPERVAHLMEHGWYPCNLEVYPVHWNHDGGYSFVHPNEADRIIKSWEAAKK